MAEVLDIILEVAGDEGAQFRNRNRLGEIEREVVMDIDKAEDLFIGCELQPVIHGRYETKAETSASLVILDFRFQSNKRNKRILKAEISVLFSDENNGGPEYDPIVREISFAPSNGTGHHELFPTTRIREVKRVATVDAHAGTAQVSLTGGYSYEVAEKVESRDSCVLEATKRVRGRGTGRKNAAEWALFENASARKGIPTFFRAAILLEHQPDARGRRFKAVVDVKARLDAGTRWEENIRNVIGRRQTPIVDPVIFDPGRKDQTSSALGVDTANLKGTDFSKVSAILAENTIE